MSANRPVQEFRVGSIKATIWANPTDQGVRHNVTLARIYKTEEGWKTAEHFRRDDIPLLIKVLVRAHDWMYADNDPIDTPAE